MFSAIKKGLSLVWTGEQEDDLATESGARRRRRPNAIDDSNMTAEEREIMRRYEDYDDYGNDVYDPTLTGGDKMAGSDTMTGPPKKTAAALLTRPRGAKVVRPEGASSDDDSDGDVYSDANSDSTVTVPESDGASTSTSDNLAANGRNGAPPSATAGSKSSSRRNQSALPPMPYALRDDTKLASAFSDVFQREEPMTEMSGRPFRRGPRELLERHQELRTRLRSRKFMLPGEKNWAPNKHVRQARMKSYNIPDALLTAIDLGDDIEKTFPSLAQSLDMKTYIHKFHALLWCEEAAEVLAMREFDLDSVGLYKLGEYISLRVPGLADGRPSLISGDRVTLSRPGSTDNIFWEGFIHYVRKDDVLLKFHRSFHEEYNGESYNVHFHSGRSQVKREHFVIDNFAPYLGEKVLFPSVGNVFFQQSLMKIDNEKDISWVNTQLNQRQKFAIMNILRGLVRPTPYLVFGPPGTGKTVTIVEAIIQVYKNFPESRILACGISNAASNLIAIKLLESKALNTEDMVRLMAANRFDDIPDELKDIVRKEENSMDSISEWLMKRVIITTCGQSGVIWRQQILPNHFTHVFIDEAAQATEPETLVPLTLAALCNGVVVLSGDPLQLGPVILSTTAKRSGLGRPMMCRLMEDMDVYKRHEDAKFEKLSGYNPDFITKLVYNYRSDPSIMSISNELFYGNELKCAYEVDHDLLKQIGFESSVVFHAIRGEDLRDADCPSWFNPQEVVEVSKYLQTLYQAKLSAEDIGIITPYRKQTEKIRMFIRSLDMEMPKVATIEEFQGGERNIIILSTVRSSPELLKFDKRYNLGFVFNKRRINVALSRAKALMIVIGNPDILCMDKTWSRFIAYCIENKYIRGEGIQASSPVNGDTEGVGLNKPDMEGSNTLIPAENNSEPLPSSDSDKIVKSLRALSLADATDDDIPVPTAFGDDYE